MSKLRAVMDTNVLYSALRSNLGASFEIFRRLRAGEWILLSSNTVVTEYEEILHRQSADLGLDKAEFGPLLDDLCHLAERHPRLEPRAPMLPDPDDEAFAQLAAAAAAERSLPTTSFTTSPPAARASR